MKKRLFAILALLPFIYSTATGADDTGTSTAKAEIVDYGLFKLTGTQQDVANPDTLDGSERNATGAQFLQKTDKIPAKIGAQFGFRYKITGDTERGSADFKMVVSHPAIKNEKGEVETQYSTTETLPVKNGVVSEVSGYSLDRPEELVPGVWTFEIWYHGKKLASQSFTVLAPDAAAKGTGNTP